MDWGEVVFLVPLFLYLLYLAVKFVWPLVRVPEMPEIAARRRSREANEMINEYNAIVRAAGRFPLDGSDPKATKEAIALMDRALGLGSAARSDPMLMGHQQSAQIGLGTYEIVEALGVMLRRLDLSRRQRRAVNKRLERNGANPA